MEIILCLQLYTFGVCSIFVIISLYFDGSICAPAVVYFTSLMIGVQEKYCIRS